MADSSFDIVSKVDRQEADNALNQATKELSQRFDFKNTGANVRWTGELSVEIEAGTEERALAALDVFRDKLVKRHIIAQGVQGRRPTTVGQGVQDRGYLPGRTQHRERQEDRQDHPRRRAQGGQDPGAGRRVAGVGQIARCPARGHLVGQGPGPRLRGAIRQLPLNGHGGPCPPPPRGSWALPTAAAGVLVLPTAAAGVLVLPTAAAGVLVLPTAAAGVLVLPTAAAGVLVLPTAAAGVLVLPTAAAGVLVRGCPVG